MDGDVKVVMASLLVLVHKQGVMICISLCSAWWRWSLWAYMTTRGHVCMWPFVEVATISCLWGDDLSRMTLSSWFCTMSTSCFRLWVLEVGGFWVKALPSYTLRPSIEMPLALSYMLEAFLWGLLSLRVSVEKSWVPWSALASSMDVMFLPGSIVVVIAPYPQSSLLVCCGLWVYICRCFGGFLAMYCHGGSYCFLLWGCFCLSCFFSVHSCREKNSWSWFLRERERVFAKELKHWRCLIQHTK